MVRSSRSRPSPAVRARRPVATRTLSAAISRARAAVLRDPQRVARVGEAGGARAGQHLDAERAQAARDRPRQLGVVDRQDAVLRLDDRDLGAELGEGDAELEPDIAGADHDEPLRARPAATAPRSRR